jgi:integrase/recombinase XerD
MDHAIQDFVHALVAEHGASPNTLSAYRTDLRQLADFLRRQRIATWSDVSPDLLTAFATYLAAREYAATSVARKLAATRRFFRYLHRTGAVEHDPTGSLGSPHIEKCLPHILSQQELGRLFRQIPTSTPAGRRDAAMVQLLHATGLRVSELVSLRLTDLDSDLARIRCVARKGRERSLPLSAAAQRALRAYLDGGRPQMARGAADGAIFLNHHGEQLTRQGFWLIMKGYARAAGIADVTPHTLRHAFALNLIGQGMDLRDVQELLGHANLSTTQMYRRLPLEPVGAADHEPAPSNAGSTSGGLGTDEVNRAANPALEGATGQHRQERIGQ